MRRSKTPATVAVVLPDSLHWPSAVKLKYDRAVNQATKVCGWTDEEVAARMTAMNAKRESTFHDAKLRSEVNNSELLGWFDEHGEMVAYAVFQVSGFLGDQPRIAFVPDVVFSSSATRLHVTQVTSSLKQQAAVHGAVRMQISCTDEAFYGSALKHGAEPVRHTFEFDVAADPDNVSGDGVSSG